MKRILIYIVLPLLLNGCSNQIEEQPEPSGYDNIQITFSLQVENLHTRSEEDDISKKVNTLEVLVFEEKEGTYTYSYRATAAEKTDENDQYSVFLRSTNEKVKLLLIANHTDFQQLHWGESVEEATEGLLHSFTAAGINYIPMYDEILLTNGLQPGVNINNITLLRSVAAIEIRLGVQLYPTNKFSLKTIQAYRANDQIQIIPNPGTVNIEDNKWKVTAPSVPSGLLVNNDITTTSVNAEEVTDEISVRIYLPEFKTTENIQSDATCLIIGGVYQNSGTTYYRVDFKDNTQQPTGQILRNHLYKIEITDVTGPGTTHPEEAVEKSILTKIESWSNSEHPLEL